MDIVLQGTHLKLCQLIHPWILGMETIRPSHKEHSVVVILKKKTRIKYTLSVTA